MEYINISEALLVFLSLAATYCAMIQLVPPAYERGHLWHLQMQILGIDDVY